MNNDVGNRNVIFITADQLRADCIVENGKYSKFVKTPNLDRLKKLGVSFEKHYTQTCPCGPARASLHTSRYLFNHMVYDNGIPLPTRISETGWPSQIFQHTNKQVQPYLLGYVDLSIDLSDEQYKDKPEMIHWEGGYLKHLKRIDDMDFIGTKKWLNEHLDFHPYNEEHKMFETVKKSTNGHLWNGYTGQSTWLHTRKPRLNTTTDDNNTNLPPRPTLQKSFKSSVSYLFINRTMEFINTEIANKRNFALHLSFLKPHPPWVVPTPYHELYSKDSVRQFLKENGYFKSHDEILNNHPYIEKVNTTANPFAHRFGASGGAAHVNMEERVTDLCNYFALITELDDNIGRLLDYLENQKLLQNTMIVFTCDHGEQLYDHNFIGKLGLFEDSFNIPCIVYAPSCEQNKIVDTKFTESIDVAPTIIEFMCGKDKIPRCYDGKSLFPFLQKDFNNNNNNIPWRDGAHFEYDFSFWGWSPKDTQAYMDFTGKMNNMKRSECMITCLRKEKWKLVYFANSKLLPPILFDMINDPNETTNVSAENQNVLLEMISEILNWKISYNGRSNDPLSNMKIISDGVVVQLNEEEERSKRRQRSKL